MSTPEVTIVDYGVGNLMSVRRGLEHCGAKVTLSGDPDVILKGPRVVLPGVGAFPNGMTELHRLGLVQTVREVARRGTPLLGICLGMQMLLDESDEFGTTAGLGLVPGRVVAVPGQTVGNAPQKIPHIGWNALVPAHDSRNWRGTVLGDNKPGDPVYFVHSFMATPSDESHRLADCIYGGHRIAAVIMRANITGCQFHPEKSGEVGLKCLRRFVAS